MEDCQAEPGPNKTSTPMGRVCSFGMDAALATLTDAAIADADATHAVSTRANSTVTETLSAAASVITTS